MLDWVHVWRQRWPGKGGNVVGSQELCGEPCRMWSGFVLLKDRPLSCQNWNNMGCKNFIDISLRIQASFNLHQWTPFVEIDHSPHHHTSTTVRRSFINAIL